MPENAGAERPVEPSSVHNDKRPDGSGGASRERCGYRWVCVTSRAPFAPRDGAGAVVYDGKMWLLGGWSRQDKVHFPLICNNEVWNSVDGADWTLVKPNTFAPQGYDPQRDWSGRHCSGYVIHHGELGVRPSLGI